MFILKPFSITMGLDICNDEKEVGREKEMGFLRQKREIFNRPPRGERFDLDS